MLSQKVRFKNNALVFINKMVIITLLMVFSSAIASCAQNQHLFYKYFKTDYGIDLQTRLSEKHLFSNMVAVDKNLYLYHPMISNNIFLLQNISEKEDSVKFKFIGSILKNSPLQYPISITHDSMGNLYILDIYQESRDINLNLVTDSTKIMHRIYYYNPINDEIFLMLEHRGSYGSLSKMPFYRPLKVIMIQDQPLLFHQNSKGKYSLVAINFEKKETVDTIFTFEHEIIDLDNSQDTILVLDERGYLTSYELLGNRLLKKEQFSLPKVFFDNSRHHFKVLYSKHTDQIIVYSYDYSYQEGILIKSAYVHNNGIGTIIKNLPDGVLGFVKLHESAELNKEFLYSIESRANKTYFNKLEQ